MILAMPVPSFELRFAAAADFERHWRDHLSRGGAWLRAVQLTPDAACELVLIGPGGARAVVAARAVFVDGSGTGLAIEQFGPPLRAQLEALRVVAPDAGAGPAAPSPAEATEAAGSSAAIAGDDAGDAGDDDNDEDDEPRDPIARNVHERLRNLPLTEQIRFAREGEAHERVVLERMYGKTVWEPLLRNPRVTHPEIARIARMGALPRPLIEIIVANTAWLKIPEVRRSLLSNPRLSADQILRVLRLLPKQELKLAPLQTTYPVAVREAARRLLVG
jgi:hypothetical protein